MALFLTIAEVAKELGVSRHTIHRGIEAGTIPVKKISSRTWRIPATWLLSEDRSFDEQNNVASASGSVATAPNDVATVADSCSNSGATSPQRLTDIHTSTTRPEGRSATPGNR
jgi:excisionase family DNA binding protein